ncbi:MAG: AAA family ATPase [Gemmatimonadales bacterium]
MDGAPAPAELVWRKNLALLIYLARSPRRTRTREHLIGLLWPEKPESAARHSLSVALAHLRRHGGDAVLETDAGMVRLSDRLVRLDVDHFEHLRSTGDYRGAAELVAGEFLEGMTLDTASDFEDWLAAERTLWRERAIEVLSSASEGRLAEGGSIEALEIARRAVRLDPSNGQAVRAVMRALALAGRRADAQAAYDALRLLLGAAGAAADPLTVSLAERIARMRPAEEVVRRGTPTAGDARRPPLVGREAELAALYGEWCGSRASGKAALLIVEGEAGMGKTRLAAELLRRIRLDGGTTVELRAVPADASAMGSGLDGIIDGGLLDAPGLASASPDALAAMVARSAAWADRFGGVVGGIAPAPLARALREALQAALGTSPVTVLVDDAQWLDSASGLALGAALRDLASCPFVVVFCLTPHSRREEIDELRRRIGRDVRGAAVKLAPLATEALRSLAAWALPEYDTSQIDRLTRRLVSDSAGIPLLATELVNGVALGLDLKGTAKAWPAPQRTLDHTLPGDLPDAIVAAIRAGFWRLSEPAQRALTLASLLPDRVRPEAVSACTGLEGDSLHGALDELEWQRWLAADSRGYTFVARIVRLVIARDMLTEGQRQRALAAIAAMDAAGGT